MAISFEESLKRVKEQKEQVPYSVLINDTKENNINLENTVPVVYTTDDWTLDNKYLYYEEYHDDAVSIIDDKKDIILDLNQINLTQETNSQFIPFEMPRFYDGFDLKTTNILIHFVNKNKYEDFANPINVYYNLNKIKFGWLVDKRVTAVEGNVKFEIQAIGKTSKGDEYVWKTKPSDGLNILKSLSGNGIIEPNNSWVTDFMIQITEQVSLVQATAEEAKLVAEEAKNSIVAIDTTLTQSGQSADAKATGDSIILLQENIDKVSDLVGEKPVIEQIKTAIDEVSQKFSVQIITWGADD